MKRRYQFSIRTLLFLITWASVSLAVLPLFPTSPVSAFVAVVSLFSAMLLSGIAMVKWEEKRNAANDERDE